MLDVGQRVQFDGHQAKGSELICDYLLGAFEDCIGLRVGCGHNYCLDSIGLKEFLKFNSCEGKFQDYVVRLNEKSVYFLLFCVVQDLESLRLFKFLSIVLLT
jgi:hypothetical protein